MSLRKQTIALYNHVNVLATAALSRKGLCALRLAKKEEQEEQEEQELIRIRSYAIRHTLYGYPITAPISSSTIKVHTVLSKIVNIVYTT
jgi:hypothetical protein